MTPNRSYYLGPRQTRLLASSWNDIVTAAGDGVLDETHWVELKQDIPAKTPGAVLEAARDLASLAVDGGVLIVGVEDKDGQAGEVVGTQLAGLRDRLTQIARGTISPPLHVVVDEYPDPSDPDSGAGVLVVTVPASESAPHMVDGLYWGRNAVGKQRLVDEEVRRLLTLRSQRTTDFDDRLRSLAEQLDPRPGGPRSRSHIYLLAEPATALLPTVATDSLGESWDHLEFVRDAVPVEPRWHRGSPSMRGLRYRFRHPDGVGLTSMAVFPDDWVAEREGHLLLLLCDDGSVQLASARGTIPEQPGSEGSHQLIEARYVLDLVFCFLGLVAHLAEGHLGYVGQWRVGIYMDQLRDVTIVDQDADFNVGTPPFQRHEYLQTLVVDTDELRDSPVDIVVRLCRRLLRGLGADQSPSLLPYEPPPPVQATGGIDPRPQR